MLVNTSSGVRGLKAALAVAGTLIATSGAAAAPRSQIRHGRVHVELQDVEGKSIAQAKAEAGKSNSAALLVERTYEPGDRISFGGVPWMALRWMLPSRNVLSLRRALRLRMCRTRFPGDAKRRRLEARMIPKALPVPRIALLCVH